MSLSGETSEQLFARNIGKKEYLRFKNQISYMKESIMRNSTRQNLSNDVELLVKDSILHNSNTNYKTSIAMSEQAVKGSNAWYFLKYNRIFVNRKKDAAGLVHELGHAKTGNLIAYMGRYSKLARPVILACAILKKKDNTDESQGGFVNFVKKHCVELTCLTALPTLLDEGLASINGAKLAQKAGIGKDLLKIINKANCKGYMTYIASALTLIGTVFTASKIRDAI